MVYLATILNYLVFSISEIFDFLQAKKTQVYLFMLVGLSWTFCQLITL